MTVVTCSELLRWSYFHFPHFVYDDVLFLLIENVHQEYIKEYKSH